MPSLERDWNPSLTGALVQLGTLSRDEEDYWAGEMERLAAEHFKVEPSVVLVNAKSLARMAPAVARRLVRRAIEIAKGDLSRMDFHHVERVLALARKTAGHGRLILPDLDVRRSFDLMRFRAAGEPVPKAPLVVWNEVDRSVFEGLPGSRSATGRTGGAHLAAGGCHDARRSP